MRDDETIRQIERFPFRRAPVAAEWRNKGYTLLHAETGRLIARLLKATDVRGLPTEEPTGIAFHSVAPFERGLAERHISTPWRRRS